MFILTSLKKNKTRSSSVVRGFQHHEGLCYKQVSWRHSVVTGASLAAKKD
jgi:hypothetical protein